ncbi:MAG: cysteine synthase family protein [Deltaproteobacteria bacterium]
MSAPSRARTVGSIAEAVGRTPMARLRSVEPEGAEVWAKLEFLNPGGSVKDRPALNLIQAAEKSGELRPGMSIIDSTSGNTGVALALYGAARGYEVTLVMPENVSSARKSMLSTFGAKIIYSDPMDGSDGAIELVRKIVEEQPGRYFYTNQYNNEANWRAHHDGTAEEIIEALGDRITHFVAGIGTSGTVMGTGRRLRAFRDDIEVIGVEPDDEFHGLEGLKYIETSIRPGIYDRSVLTRTFFCPTDAGWDSAEALVRDEGLLVGHSAGAVVHAAKTIAEEALAAGKKPVVVAVLPDHASRYVEVRES